MPVSRRSAQTLSVALLTLTLAGTAGAQVGTWPVISVTQDGECPGPLPHEAATSVPNTGLINLWIHPDGGDSVGQIGGARFGLRWPEGWSLQAIQVCRGTLEYYACFASGCAFSIELDATGAFEDYKPAIHLIVNATVPGRCSVVSNPLTGEFEYLDDYSQEWWQYYDEGAAFIEVGNFPCSWPLAYPDDYCSMIVEYRGRPLGRTETFDLHAGETRADTVTIEYGDCYNAPECPQSGGHECDFRPFSDVPWITYRFLDHPTESTRRYSRIIDATGLSVGTHIGGAGKAGRCAHSRCGRNCQQVHLTVLPPRAIHSTSWGRIKATYRGEDEAPDRAGDTASPRWE